jgi:hypothetical protein
MATGSGRDPDLPQWVSVSCPGLDPELAADACDAAACASLLPSVGERLLCGCDLVVRARFPGSILGGLVAQLVRARA